MFNTIKSLFGFGSQIDFAELVKKGAVIIDVRSKSEYASGHIKGSVNIPVELLGSHLAKFKSRNKTIITCCASGVRSASARRFLKSNGLTDVYNGGSWRTLQTKI